MTATDPTSRGERRLVAGALHALPRPIPPPPRRPGSGRRAGLALAVVAVGLVLAFALGRWSSGAPPEAAAAGPAAVAPAASEPSSGRQPPAAVPPRPALAGAPVSSHPPEPARALTPQTVARVVEDAKARLEDLRPYIVSRCWPSGGLAGGRTSARLTFDITFDAEGREIARGVSEDRRAPAGEFGRCLRSLEGTALSIRAPGSNVGVSLSINYP
jgi:hypothetical protein